MINIYANAAIKDPELIGNGWNVPKQKLLNNYRSVLKRYSIRDTKLNNVSVLVKLMNMLLSDPTGDYYNYMEYVDLNHKRVERLLGISNEMSVGKVLGDPMVRSGKFVMYGVSSFDIFSPNDNIPSINIIKHDSTSIDMNHMTDIDVNYGVFTIDTVRLMYHYREWYLRRLKEAPSMSRSVQTFLYIQELPRVILSYTNVSLFNRFIGRNGNNEKKEHAIAIADLNGEIDTYVFKYRKRLTNTSLRIGEMSSNIPSLTHKSFGHFILSNSPDIMTTYNTWAVYLFNIRYINDLLSAVNDVSYRKNKSILRVIARVLRRVLKGNYFRVVKDEFLRETLSVDTELLMLLGE